MTLPTSGVMKASAIRTELKGSGIWKIGASNSRGLAKKSSGLIKFSDFRGKSSIRVIPIKLTKRFRMNFIAYYKYSGMNQSIKVEGVYDDADVNIKITMEGVYSARPRSLSNKVTVTLKKAPPFVLSIGSTLPRDIESVSITGLTSNIPKSFSHPQVSRAPITGSFSFIRSISLRRGFGFGPVSYSGSPITSFNYNNFYPKTLSWPFTKATFQNACFLVISGLKTGRVPRNTSYTKYKTFNISGTLSVNNTYYRA